MILDVFRGFAVCDGPAMLAGIEVDGGDSAPWRFHQRQTLRTAVGPRRRAASTLAIVDGGESAASLRRPGASAAACRSAAPPSSAATADIAHVGPHGIGFTDSNRIVLIER